MKNKALKPIIIGSLIILFVGLSGLIGYLIYNNQTKKQYNPVAANSSEKQDPEYKQDYDKIKVRIEKDGANDKKAILNIIHRMANSKIEAEDGEIWGSEDITLGKCDALLGYIKDHTDSIELSKDEIDIVVDCLNKWSNKDYSESAKVHNIVWSKLGGTVGKAKEN